MNIFHEAEKRRDGDLYPSQSTPSSSTPSAPPRATLFLPPPPPIHSFTFQKNPNLNSSLTSYASPGKQSHPDQISSFSSTLEITPSSHPFNSGEIEECDKYNPLILHHAQLQSIAQYRENRTKAYPLSIGYDTQKDYTQRTRGNSQEPRSHRHNLLYNQNLCQMDGTARVLTPKAASAASTTKSIALATLPSASSSYVTNASTSSSTRDVTTYKDSKLGIDLQKSTTSRRMSLPETPPMDRNPSRRMSCTVASPPKLLDTIFQRVWNPQQTSPVSNPSPLPSTHHESHKSNNNNQGGGGGGGETFSSSSSSSSSSSIHIRNPSSFLIVQSHSPHGDYPEGHHRPRRYSGRFINQVTFSLDESHKSGIQAILVLRRLTNGLTSDKVTTPQPTAPGNQFGSLNIPIPRISHRYPEHSTTALVNGKVRVINKKIIPSVVIDWSDGVRDHFDPTGMSLEDILGRCYCNER